MSTGQYSVIACGSCCIKTELKVLENCLTFLGFENMNKHFTNMHSLLSNLICKLFSPVIALRQISIGLHAINLILRFINNGCLRAFLITFYLLYQVKI